MVVLSVKQAVMGILLGAQLSWSAPLLAETKTGPRIVVMGLFTNSAVVQIDGQERILKVGKVSPEGVKLISANSKAADVEVQGKRYTLVLNRGIGTRFSEAAKTEVRIASQVNGHYVTPGRINNKAVEFLVDTGATSIAMNADTARHLGINYSTANAVSVQTAQGSTQAYAVVLDSASVGEVTVFSPEALIIDGEFPKSILLGNTFLSRVDLKVEQGVMVLQTKY